MALFKVGKTLTEIAMDAGYPKNHGLNRTRRVLIAAGIFGEKKAAAKRRRNQGGEK